MAKLLKLRRGTTSQHGSFTGAEGEVTIDTTKDTAVIHDGSTQGGTPLAKENMDNVSSTNLVTRIDNSALAGVKVQPNFGSQNVETTGTLASGNHTVTGNIAVTGTVDGVNVSALDSTVGSLGIANGAIASATTATTQSAGDNSTKVSTTAYTDTAITNLVDSSPAALNTLNELAAALGDDANFSTTVTNSIATKLPLAGGTLTGHVTFNDNQKARFGTDNDTDFYHTDTDFFVVNNKGNIDIRAKAGEKSILAKPDDGVELYHDNSKKLETTASGITCYGSLIPSPDGSFNIGNSSNRLGDVFIKDVASIKLGDSQDFKIVHENSNNYLLSQNNHDIVVRAGTGDAYLQGNDVVLGDSTGAKKYVHGNEDGSVDLYHNNTLQFRTIANGFRLKNGHMQLNEADGMKAIFGVGNDLFIRHTGSLNEINSADGSGGLNIVSDETRFVSSNGENQGVFTANGAVKLYYDHSQKLETVTGGVNVTGDMTASGNVTAYSDETLKKDISTINDALSLCGKLRGVSYKWKENDKADIGVIAQEVEKVIPEVVVTQTVDGKEIKSVDYGRIVGVLINAINEQQEQYNKVMTSFTSSIQELKDEIETLKGG